MIEPTPGRVVWFRPHEDDHTFTGGHGNEPLAALIAKVHSNRLINVAAFDENGHNRGVENVTLLQDDDPKPEKGLFACWMPYQTGQAAKTEAAEKAAAVPAPPSAPAPAEEPAPAAPAPQTAPSAAAAAPAPAAAQDAAAPAPATPPAGGTA